MNDDIINELYLPLSNPNEDLETISANFFRPLFDVLKFEIRPEPTRDKGIDFHIELKASNASGKTIYTNFRFIVQLKATESITPNKDNSISLQLNTSNINYLLRNAMPAYYVLYFTETKTFYIESITDFVAELYNKDQNWSAQPTHVIRFTKILDSQAINDIYDATMQKGKFQRTINEKIIMRSQSSNPDDKILFDKNFNVTADGEIRKIIEAIGMDLVNEGKWTDVLAVHKKASGGINNSGMYNFVLGVANYHSGKWMDALSFFNSAKQLRKELSADVLNHLSFFEASIKYSLGIMGKEQYITIMASLEDAENLGLYIRTENAKNAFLENMDGEGEHEKFIAEMNAIINHEKADDSIKLNVEAETLLLDGYRINMEYIQVICRINAIELSTFPNPELRKEAILNYLAEDKDWTEKIQALKTKSLVHKNRIIYHNTLMYEARIRYQFIAQAAHISLVVPLDGAPELKMPDRNEMCDLLLNNAILAFNYFNDIGHFNNCVAALSLMYEINHFKENFQEAGKIMAVAETLIETYDLNEHRDKLQYLKNEGTTHEHFKNWMGGIQAKSQKDKDRFMQQREEMIKMDDIEKQAGHRIEEAALHMMLFPIGYFQFPLEKKEKVYEILNVTATARIQFDNMFKMVMPVANIYYDIIDQEGYKDGKLADTGLDKWDNIYRVRKAFYENQFYRFHPKF